MLPWLATLTKGYDVLRTGMAGDIRLPANILSGHWCDLYDPVFAVLL